jgi:Cell wall-associated hydrolases (invasion-associated proteins)
MKRTSLLLLILSLVLFATPAVHAQTAAQRDTGEVEISARELADKLVEYAEQFLGTKYRYGANGPDRFDCTGYTRYVYGHFGFHNLSRSAKDQAKDGREVDISDFHNLQKGDILILGSRRNPKVVGHVGIFTGLDSTGRDPRFIHASNHGVRYSTLLTETYYSNRLLGARRILPDFEVLEVDFDSTAVYSFDPKIGARISPDSLILAAADRRIVLFENGKWAFVGDDGSLVVPEQANKIVLSGDGNWAPLREAKVSVPTASLKTSTAKPDTTAPVPTEAPDTTARPASPADTSASVPAAAPTVPAEPEKIYHTIKKGDTLSKIAKQHHTTVNRICELNGINSKTILRVGRKLRVK